MLKLCLIKSKTKNPHQLIKRSAENMNKITSAKYGISPDDVEKCSLLMENFPLGFNFDRIKTVKKAHYVLDKYDAKIYLQKKKKLREDLATGENVLLLAERIKKKSAPGKFYKSSVQNSSFFNKEQIFVISNKSTIAGKIFYWLADVRDKKLLKERFQRQEIFAIENNFI